jgi:hypothetical protein
MTSTSEWGEAAGTASGHRPQTAAHPPRGYEGKQQGEKLMKNSTYVLIICVINTITMIFCVLNYLK